MSVAKVYSLESVRTKFQTKKIQQSYMEYLKLLTIEELEKEVYFFMENHTHKAQNDPQLAMRGYCMMLEMAKRIDCSLMQNKVIEMAESFKSNID